MLLMQLRHYWLPVWARYANVPLLGDRRAVTAIEYAIIAGVIAAAVVGAVSKIGPELTPTFNAVSSEL